MTLLLFSVRIPDQAVSEAKLQGELLRMLGESYGLVLSFAIIAMVWVGHLRLLNSLRHATVGLIYLALLQLFWIVLSPISTSLWTRIETKETILVMGVNLLLIHLSGLLMWLYCCGNRLFESDAFAHPIAIELVGPIFPLVIFALSLVVTLWTSIPGDRLWWGAFATPFVVHLARAASRKVAMAGEESVFVRSHENGRRL
jgi:uncharacterized membrane protein